MLIWIYSAMPAMGYRPQLVMDLFALQPAIVRVAPNNAAQPAKISKAAKVSVPEKVMLVSHTGSHIQLPMASLRTSSPIENILSHVSDSTFEVYEPSIPVVTHAAPSKFLDESAKPILPWNEKLVNLNLSATALETVILTISKQTGVNVVLLAKTDQKVTINVTQMPIGDALRHLSMLAGLRTIKVRNTIVMAEEATLKGAYPKEYDLEYNNVAKPADADPSKGSTTTPVQPPVEVVDTIQRIYTLKYQGATQVVTSLKEYFTSKKVTIVALPNTLLPNIGAAGNSGSGSGSSGGNSGSPSGGAAVPVDTRAKRVLLSGPAAAVQESILILQQMDIPRRQVEITVTIHDVSNDALRDAGVTWDFGQSTISEAVNGNMNVGTFSRTGLSFVGTIHALEQANKAKLLASPNISVMDGELGSILIGEKRRFPVVTGTTSNGQFIYSTEEQNVGIYMLVATDITDDGTVTLAINAQVSSILGFLQLNGGSYPQISTRESKSTLLLKDGQTMLMGGLLRDEEIVNLQKVPFLGQIPFFGELFKSRKTQKNSSQLLISITPHIIKQ